ILDERAQVLEQITDLVDRLEVVFQHAPRDALRKAGLREQVGQFVLKELPRGEEVRRLDGLTHLAERLDLIPAASVAQLENRDDRGGRDDEERPDVRERAEKIERHLPSRR